MHAIKGGWVGQTFALAKSNESGGRKSRIRRSKEERKAMVETFIKKYQTLNNGSFPSLNLTHKECGGSFYTIREIVREVIQENRVLGPAKLTSEEQDTDQFLEQYPLGTISKGHQQPFFTYLNEYHLVSDHNQGTSEEPDLNSDGLCIEPAKLTSEEQETDQFLEQYPLDSISTEPQPTLSISSNGQGISEEPVLSSDGLCVGAEHQRLDNGQIINGSPVDVKIEESAKLNCAELQSEPVEVKKSIEDLAVSTAKVTDITKDVIVETFPIRPVTKPTDGLDGSSGEVGDLTVTSDEKEIEKVDLGPINDISLLDVVNSPGHSDLVDEGVENPADPLLERDSSVVDKSAVENLADLPLENSDCPTTKEGVVHNKVEAKLSHNGIVSSGAYEQSKAITGTKAQLFSWSRVSCICSSQHMYTYIRGDRPNLNKLDNQMISCNGCSVKVDLGRAINAPNGIHTKSLNRTYTSSNSGESTTRVTTVIENKADVKHSRSPQKGSNPTLERINLESWKGASKSTVEPERNPLWAIFQSFIAAFVKFWSE